MSPFSCQVVVNCERETEVSTLPNQEESLERCEKRGVPLAEDLRRTCGGLAEDLRSTETPWKPFGYPLDTL